MKDKNSRGFWGGGSGVYQPMSDCEFNKAGAVVDVQFFHRIRAMAHYRLYADAQQFGHLFIRVPLGY